MPKVSICIPTYKQIDLLDKCIDSVITQDYTDYEIIISDDTPDMSVKEFIEGKKINKKLLYFKNSTPLGTPENWNKAVSLASGEYIKLLHHDDFFTQKESLGKFVKLLDDNVNSFFGFSSTLVWNVPTGITKIHRCSNSQLQKIKKDPGFLFYRNMIGAPSATIYRNTPAYTYDKQLKWLVDIDFYISALKQNPNLVMCKEPLICTADGSKGQVTQEVAHNMELQIKEHIIVFSKIYSDKTNNRTAILFFDELFRHFDIDSKSKLQTICPIPTQLDNFFTDVFAQINKNRIYKKLRNRFYKSRLNIFNLEKY